MSRILLVEDEAMLREAFTIALMAEKFNVDTAANGQEALDKVQRSAPPYDLILLDLMMPVLDGVGFLKSANLPKTAPGTKVFVLSNLSSGEEISEVMELGIHGYKLKASLTPNDVITLVRDNL
ncbi:response regulator transcription factor [Candidatus Saccharibacteria bacterium]|nr:response regulator transcription factor [Candidatus Saccharibacteria bacterium]